MEEIVDEFRIKRNVVFSGFAKSLACIPVYMFVYILMFSMALRTPTGVNILEASILTIVLGLINLAGVVYVFVKEFPWVSYD